MLNRKRPFVASCALWVACWAAAHLPLVTLRAADSSTSAANAAAEERLAETTKYLASDALEGRGLGTHGLDLAADYMAEQFKKIGLKTDLFDGVAFQKFDLTIGAKLGPDDQNHVQLVGPAAGGEAAKKIDLKLGGDYTPLALGGSTKFDLPLVFLGYGITAKKENYDDYAGIDVKDKAVIVLRHQPQRSNPHSVFGPGDSAYAALSRKVSNAYEHGAAAIVFSTDDAEVKRDVTLSQSQWQASIDELVKANDEFKKIEHPTRDQVAKQAAQVAELTEQITTRGKQLLGEHDRILPFDRVGEETDGREFPVLHCHRAAIEPIVKAAIGVDMAALERQIDDGPKPQSRELTGWRIVGETSLKRTQVAAKNVIGVLEGEGPLADETLVIGAHYDHLGFGGPNSAAPGVHAIHPGADDNGSGSAALLEIARELAGREKKLPRRIVFIAFTGEERGLLGSARYVRNPLMPLDKTVAMLNMDMVGRLSDDKLIVYANDTSPVFDPLIDRVNAHYGFKITRQPGGFGPSDHASFYGKNLPVLHFFTGSHKDYHRPSDTADKLNVPGMRRVAQLVAEIAVALAETPERPQFAESKVSAAHMAGPQGDRPYFGSIPDFSQDQPGYSLNGVTKGSPAEKGGLKTGDIIIRLGESKIGNLEDFDSALRKHHGGDKVPVVVKRGKEEITAEITLDPPR